MDFLSGKELSYDEKVIVESSKMINKWSDKSIQLVGLVCFIQSKNASISRAVG